MNTDPVGVFFALAGVDFGGKVDYLREPKRELAALFVDEDSATASPFSPTGCGRDSIG